MPIVEKNQIDPYRSAKFICGLIGISSSTFYRWIRSGDFPKGTNLGPGICRWRQSLIDDFCNSRLGAIKTAKNEDDGPNAIIYNQVNERNASRKQVSATFITHGDNHNES